MHGQTVRETDRQRDRLLGENYQIAFTGGGGGGGEKGVFLFWEDLKKGANT